MAGRILILLLLLVHFSSKSLSQSLNHDDSLRLILVRDGQAIVNVPFTDRKTLDFLTREVSVLDVRNKEIHVCLSPVTIEWFIRQRFPYTIIQRPAIKNFLSAADVKEAMEWDSYPSYTQYDSIMQGFVTDFPGLCRLDTIGTSINGRLILALKISDNPLIDEEEPEALYTSSMHGDETGGFILMLRLIDYLLKNYNLNDRVKNLVDNLEIWINPLANPDGTYRNGNIVSSPTRFNANGIDLNRNFPDPSVQGAPLQKENIDMIAFMRKHKFVISANFHSGAEVVNYPWDRWPSRFHADDSWFNRISREYADTVHIYSDSGYMDDLDNGVTRGSEWYVIYGGRQDFVTWELQGREVTIEIDNQYVTSPARLPLLWQYNWRSLLGYLENALFGIQGKVLNSESSVPVKAMIFINGHDKDSSHVYSENTSAGYVRLLSPGIWTLVFSSPGFYNEVISNIVVTEDYLTELNVTLTPIVSSIDTTNPETPVLYPNPARSMVMAVLPSDLTGTVNVRIYNSAGLLWGDYITEIDRGIPLKVDVQELPTGVYSIIFIKSSTKVSYRSRFIRIK